MTEVTDQKTGKIRLIGIDKKFHTAPVFVTPKLNEQIPEFIVGEKHYKAKRLKDGNDSDFFEVDDPKSPVHFSSLDSFQIGHTKEFSREKPIDMFIYELALASGYVAASKEQVNPQYHRYYVEDLEQESVEEIKKAELYLEAANIVKSLSGYESMVNFGRVLGLANGRMSPNQVQATLMRAAKEQPGNLISAWNDGSRKHREFLRKLVEKKIITMKGGGFYYEKEVVGANEEFAIEYLKEPRNRAIIEQWAGLLKRDQQTKEEKAVNLTE